MKGGWLSIWIKDQRVKKSGTTFFAWIFLYKELKWKSLYPSRGAPFSGSFGLFKQCYKFISHQLANKAMLADGKAAKNNFPLVTQK